MKYQSPNVKPIVTETVNKISNAHWRTVFEDIKIQLECIVSDIVKSFIVPILDEISVQDFYEQNAVGDECASW